MPVKNKYIFIVTLSVAAVSMGLFFVALVNGWFGAATGAGCRFCEASRPGLIKQPANTWSNLGFVVAGLTMAWQLSAGTFRNNNSITRNAFYGTALSCLAVLLGPGSMAMHATTASSGGFFDMLSMYLVASFMVAYAAQRFFDWKFWHFALMFLLVLTTCLWANFQHYQIIFSFFGNLAFAFFITLGVILELLNRYVRKKHHSSFWGWGALATLILAFIIWNVSKTGSPLCYPYSPIQGHAIWHLLDAAAVYGLFRFYASEQTGMAV